MSDVFPNVSYTRAEMQGLKEEIRRVCAEEYLVCGEGDEQGSHWMDKVSIHFPAQISSGRGEYIHLISDQIISF